MRKSLLILMIGLIAPATVHAGAIQYSQIPADVTGYGHFDFDPILNSQICKELGYTDLLAEQATAVFGEHVDITMYVPKSGGPGGFVFLVHTGDTKLRERLQTNLSKGKEAVAFKYGDQDVHYVSEGWQNLMGQGAPLPTTRAQEPDIKPRKSPALTGRFSLGIGSEGEPSGKNLSNGPCYTAFVDQNLIVFAGDLPAMSNALDVITGKKPSLATQDPQGLKMTAPPGVFVMGAGMTAQFDKDNSDSAKSPASATRPANISGLGSGFGPDMIGSFKGKARLAKFDIGEDKHDLYCDGLVRMKDGDSATQLKNLAMGVKALISLTQADLKPMIDPLEIEASENKVTLHWSWPSANVSELIRLARAQDFHESANTATDATQPTH